MKKIDKILYKELENQTPNLQNQIKNNVDWKLIQENNSINKPKHSFNLKYAIASLCCLIIVSLAIILPLSINPKNINQNYTLIIDVNPSIKLSVNKDNIVTNQYGLNEDGIILLYKENFTGLNVNIATKNIIEKMNTSGFITDNIKISIVDNKGKQIKQKQDNIINNIKTYINTDNIDLIILDENQLDDIEDYYKSHDIDNYETEFINTFKDKLITVVNTKIEDINILNTILAPFNKKDENLIPDFNKQQELETFANKYKYKLDIKFDKITYEDIYDFIKDINDQKDDLIESLVDIQEEGDDYSELIEDLFELVKDELFDED